VLAESTFHDSAAEAYKLILRLRESTFQDYAAKSPKPRFHRPEQVQLPAADLHSFPAL
jgi:hypothetical protein